MPSLTRLINYGKLGLIPEEEGKTFIPNAGNHYLNVTASHPC